MSPQLPRWKADQLYPRKSSKVWFINHVLQEEDCLGRCLKSVRPYVDQIFVLIDDRTTDRSREIAESYGAKTDTFRWVHNFAWAKNEAIRKAGVPYGDWILTMGADFVLKKLDRKFTKNPCNFFGKFNVPEYTPRKDGQFVTRERKLLWRHHPAIYWERIVHEEVCYSAYRLTGLGMQFGRVPWKEFPLVGEMMHYGFHEDGGEEGKVFWSKKMYYLVLTQINRIMRRFEYPETEKGMLDALFFIYNNDDVYKWGVLESVNRLTRRVLAGDFPPGLAEIAGSDWIIKNIDDEWQ